MSIQLSKFLREKDERECEALRQSVAALNAMGAGGDAEALHVVAEDILCEYLIAIGAKELADAFNNAAERVGFWYA